MKDFEKHVKLNDLTPISAPAFTCKEKNKGEERSAKVCESIEEAIRRSGLKDGMTISFHHAFRGGDLLINTVMNIIAKMGFKDLTLASSSLASVNDPLIEHIKSGVITQIYTSGLRSKLGEAISKGLMEKPVQIHSHGGRVHLIQSGELNIDVAFLGVPVCDNFGNANGYSGRSKCGSLGYAMIDAQYAAYVVVLTESLEAYPNVPASIHQDQVDAVVVVDEVGDPSKIGAGETRMTSNPKELLLASHTAKIIEHSGLFKEGFSIQTGSGGASLATTVFLSEKMEEKGIHASFGLGGITGTMVYMLKRGLIKTLLDVQSFDEFAAKSLGENKNHIEISANEYANPSSKGAAIKQLDIVVLSALEVDLDFNVNVITGSKGLLRGASGGHSDTAAEAKLSIIVAPLTRGRIPTITKRVNTIVTPGSTVDVVVTDQGIAVNPKNVELKARLKKAGLNMVEMHELYERAIALCGVPTEIQYTDKVVAAIRYRDGSVIDVVRQLA
ncbi:citrate lyase subunit alpha [Sulfurospirillum barnesii]|uniref:Citrate lyase alpha chain n=1 Tax=Sulfurospirillum barnesii (strain ATCC 700032 / DSM 10660 / SES-3) TaxID=760154 RepID=I3XVF2_SULBS|nr:citrate lyase subunit alpha [Sulfurospirillum barnesii]AFL67926.1 citrate lyase, alpha subunit [Sulfurospirillum barnesii SES-3]